METIAVTAASLAGVQVTGRSVRYHFILVGASSGDGLTKGVAFVPIVLKGEHFDRNGPEKGAA